MYILQESDGWHTLGGDGTNPNPNMRDTMMMDRMTGGLVRNYFFCYVRDGFIVGLECSSDANAKFGDFGLRHAKYLEQMERFWGFNISERLQYIGALKKCKHNGKETCLSEDVPLLKLEQMDYASFNDERRLVEKALEKIQRKIKMTTRSWPVCGNVAWSNVQVVPFIDRENKRVVGYWRCGCGK